MDNLCKSCKDQGFVGGDTKIYCNDGGSILCDHCKILVHSVVPIVTEANKKFGRCWKIRRNRLMSMKTVFGM